MTGRRLAPRCGCWPHSCCCRWPRTALVVALHGCTQDAASYAQAGWSDYAAERGFFLLLPEQSALEHMANSCWSWFRGEDSERGSGQAASVVAMVAWLRAHCDIDPRRIYVDGLSAGGWFVPELLADYPDVFAGGATHAGGPAFCAGVRRPFWDWFGWRGAWPVLSIWQGSADYVVAPLNQRELLEQWTVLHDADATADFSEASGTRNRVLHQRLRARRRDLRGAPRRRVLGAVTRLRRQLRPGRDGAACRGRGPAFGAARPPRWMQCRRCRP